MMHIKQEMWYLSLLSFDDRWYNAPLRWLSSVHLMGMPTTLVFFYAYTWLQTAEFASLRSRTHMTPSLYAIANSKFFALKRKQKFWSISQMFWRKLRYKIGINSNLSIQCCELSASCNIASYSLMVNKLKSFKLLQLIIVVIGVVQNGFHRLCKAVIQLLTYVHCILLLPFVNKWKYEIVKHYSMDLVNK